MDSAIEAEIPVTTGFEPSPSSGLSPIQWELFSEIVRYCERYGGAPPVIRYLMRALRISSTSVVSYHLRRLERAGLIELSPGLSRGIVVVGGSWSPPAPFAHLVAGEVAA